ncbi:hypothetical protein [Megasphaera elsdenii]|uniref:hypothetical protein n=1 Tax=Megasphaera elsdenii TaxID=907 RepID=UPI00242D385A|nr:hypothetical protein [Megasphaera elsdenii]
MTMLQVWHSFCSVFSIFRVLRMSREEQDLGPYSQAAGNAEALLARKRKGNATKTSLPKNCCRTGKSLIFSPIS